MNFTSTLAAANITTAEAYVGISYTWGFLACVIAAVGFGVNYLPVKRFESGDGMFFQWIFANAVFICSFIVAGYYKFPSVEPLVMLGGFLWATGNVCVVPIIQTIGLGMGMLLWSSTGIIFGWASGRFGWFGIDPQLPKNFTLNYIGFCLTVVSPVMYSFIKTSVLPIEIKEDMLFESLPQQDIKEVQNSKKNSILEFLKRSSKVKSKIIGVSLSIFCGALFGLHFIPVTYVKNRYPNANKRDIDHILAQCSGIYLGSSFYFIIYCMIKGNKPILYPRVILPAFSSGIIWFIAYIAMFIANESLTPAITQPLTAPLCGIISSLLGVVLYREVKGIRNYIVLLIAMIIGATGATLIGLSKII